MADFGLNPPGTRHDRVVAGVSSGTGIKYGFAVIYDTSATGKHRSVKTTTSAGDKPFAGVCVTQTDPTNGSADGDSLEICDDGVVEMWLAGSQTITKGDLLITSTTAGMCKKLASETGADIIGIARQDAVTTGSPILIAVEIKSPPQRGGVS